MSLFAIADTHLSFGTDKPMEVFTGWAGFEQRLEKNWRALVGESDTVVIAGDVSWAMTLDETLPDFKFLHALPGRKILIKGNHDYWWNSKRKMDLFLQANNLDSLSILHNNAYCAGQLAVCGTRGWSLESDSAEDQKVLLREAGRLKASITAARVYDAEPVVFLHYPPITADDECAQIIEVLTQENIKRCCFGHLHAQAVKNYMDVERYGIRFSLISSDFLGFCPKAVL